MITLPNNEKLMFLTASGALAFDGKGWIWDHPFRWVGLLRPEEFDIVVKTVTLNPRKGNLRWYAPWNCVRPMQNGFVNAVGLTNLGLDWWIESVYPQMIAKNWKPILSVFPENPEEAIEIKKKIIGLELKAVELNVSCPNTGHLTTQVDWVYAMASEIKTSGYPLIVKVSYDQPYLEIVKSLESTADAVHAINTVPWKTVYPEVASPLERIGGGGVSGKAIRNYAREAVKKINDISNLPIIAGGGIYDFNDLEELWELGARAFSIGSLFLSAPYAPNLLINKWKNKYPERSIQSTVGIKQ